MRNLAVPVLMVALLAAAMSLQPSSPDPYVCDPPDARLGDIDGFTAEVMSASDAEVHMLPKDTKVERRVYKAEDGSWHIVSLVVGGKHKGSIHRPELCLPAQGFLMTNPRTMEVESSTWRVITLDGGGSRPSLGFAYTFFNQDGFRTASHTQRIFRDVWDRSVHNRIDRWAMVTVCSYSVDDRRIAAFLAKLKGVVSK